MTRCRNEKKKSKHGYRDDIGTCSTHSSDNNHSTSTSAARSGRQSGQNTLSLSKIADLVEKFEVPKVRLSKRALVKQLLKSDAAPLVGIVAPMLMLVFTLLGYGTVALCLIAFLLVGPTCFVCLWEYHLQEVEVRAKSLARDALSEAAKGNVSDSRPSALASYSRSFSKKDTMASDGDDDRERRDREKRREKRRREKTDGKKSREGDQPKREKDVDPSTLDDAALITTLKYDWFDLFVGTKLQI